jgi:hypothetical protein
MPAKSAKAALTRTRDQAGAESKPLNAKKSVRDTGRITVDLGADRYRDLTRAAAWHEQKMADVVRELIDGWLADHPIS